MPPTPDPTSARPGPPDPPAVGGAAPDPRVVVLGREGCHLCEDVVEVVARVAGELGVGWVERSIVGDADLLTRYRELIPVVLVDGVELSHWRVDEAALRAALTRS